MVETIDFVQIKRRDFKINFKSNFRKKLRKIKSKNIKLMFLENFDESTNFSIFEMR